MSVILFIDMLGARKRWQLGGVEESMPTFFRFKKQINIALRQAPAGEVLDGIIETDAAMIVCRSAVEAVKIARKLFLEAFKSKLNSLSVRNWYRGCILSNSSTFLRRGNRLRSPVENMTTYRYSESALEAVSVEKSGYKGMRILIDKDLVDLDFRSEMNIKFETHTLLPVSTLKYSNYPQRVAGQYSDYLWMATKSDSDWRRLRLHMDCRLRYSNIDPDEMAQAAATQVVFNECSAIRQSVISRDERTRRGIVRGAMWK